MKGEGINGGDSGKPLPGYEVLPRLNTIIKIDGRWAQISSTTEGGELRMAHIRFLDDATEADIDFRGYAMARFFSCSVSELVARGWNEGMTGEMIGNIYSGSANPRGAFSVEVVGEYNRNPAI